MLDFLIDPFAFPFMVRALLAVVLVGAVCGALGVYVVLRGMAFLGDALAHAILPGVAVGYMVGGGARGPLFWWGLGTAVLASLGIGAVSRGARIKEDTAIGIIFAGMFALGIALVSTMRSYAVDLSHLLFGNVLGIGPTDLVRVGVFGVLVIIVILVLYKEFLVLSFDPILAATLRMPVTLLHHAMLLLLAVAVVVSMQTVGVAMMIAMLVTPAATALLLTRRLPRMMMLSSALGALSGVAGLYLSYYLGMAPGPAIVLVATSFFLLAFLFSPQRGLVRWRTRPTPVDARTRSG
jgi:manganese/iron transport system permease protein